MLGLHWLFVAWFLTHGEHFTGERLPFGCLVRYLPNRTKSQRKKDGRMTFKDKQAKWDARSRAGVFVGYDMKPGYHWSQRYLVWDLDSFQGADLFATTERCLKSASVPHKTRRLRLPPGEIQFPLKDAYVKANDTLEGRTAAMETKHSRRTRGA